MTGAAGAIGSGIVRGLLRDGCHVAATDLAGAPLDSLVAELRVEYGERVTGVALDVADAESVAAGFAAVCATFGGVDLLVINAGLAHVATLGELDLDAFRRLERVNVEGTLLLLQEAERVLRDAADRRRRGAGLDQERLRTGRGLRRLLGDEGGVAPARAHRESRTRRRRTCA